MVRRTLLAAALAVATLPCVAARADDSAAIESVSKYLNSVVSMQGDFRQVEPSGVISEGKYWLRRPGRLRFEYSSPNPLVVIADGFWVAVIEDQADKSVDRIPLSETPLYLLLKEDVDLAKEFEIRSVKDGEQELWLTAVDPKEETLGEVTLVFDKNPLRLKQWIVTDAQGLTTTIALRSAEANVDIANDLFVIPENAIGNGGRN